MIQFNQNYDRLIIDGNNLMYRAYYTKRAPKFLHGLNTTPLHQFIYLLKNIVEKHRPKEIFITWDKKLNENGLNFRKTLSAYKEQRPDDEHTRNIVDYIDYVSEFIEALGIRTILPYNLEGDDVINFISKKDSCKTIILSCDKDLLQLVSKNVHMEIPSKGIITLENFEQMVDVKYEAFVLYKAILGDTSDNIQGLEKYGPVRAKKLAEKILETSFEEAGLTDEQKKMIELNIRLMDLEKGIEENPDDLKSYEEQYQLQKIVKYDSDKLRNLFKHYGFYNFVSIMGEFYELFNNNQNEEIMGNLMDNFLDRICI